MNFETMPMLLDTVKQHLPTGATWIMPTILGGVALVGFVFVVKGARLLRGIAALVLGAAGVGLGSLLPGIPGAPDWVGIAAGGVVGVLFGVVLFRIWLALLVAACVVSVSLAVYASQAQSLAAALSEYSARGLQGDQVTVQPTPEAAAAASAITLAGAWDYVNTHAAGFRENFYTIVFAAGLAGLVFGLLLPKLARSFWAATVGSGLLLIAAHQLLSAYSPNALGWFAQWGLIIAAGVWGLSLLANLMDMYGVRLKKRAQPATKAAASK